jgi:putative ABC transport system permease protein
MRTPLAWHNLVHNKVRTAVATAGVTFAVVLIFMQLGFLGSVKTTVTQIYDALDFDLAIRSRQYLHLADTRVFHRDRLYQAASLSGVEEVMPLYVRLNSWRNPINGRRRMILVMGTRPEDAAFTVSEIRTKTQLLTDREFVLIDRKSRQEFGPRNGQHFSDADIGQVSEVANRRVQIVGHFELGTGLAADGAILLNSVGFCRLFPGRTLDDVSLGLVKLADGARPAEAAARLQESLPADVETLTRAELVRMELDRWIRETSIGVIFQVGVIVALVVGTVIVYQVLSSDVANHMAEYATLKAMGYTGRHLSTVVLMQAVFLSVLGFVPGLAVSEALYRMTSWLSNIPILMNSGRILFVLVLTVAMCTVSGLGAMRKLNSAEPADLF